ncbi:MAG: ATP-grasp domain-containing protein [Bacteroidia bacterium]|nr:ATP-grasp domain-containing protein [Bacteroidia bacterium]
MEFETINTILVANRGEIAARVIRTCKKMGIRTVAVFSEADRYAPFVRQADTAVYIGASPPHLSYLDQDKIIHAAQKTSADAIHPGYGFLAENSVFARRCASEGIIFVGPNAVAIDAMGSKSRAKSIMQAHQVPTVPGYQGKDQDLGRLVSEAEKIGFPLLIKPTAGGGGKGMRIVHDKKKLKPAFEAAKREAQSSFGNDELLIERYIQSGRHIEFQIFGDQHGHAIHLLERECSIQRRYQKIVEESPSSIMTEQLRQSMGEAAVNAAKALNYDNAGTVEFIFDDQTGDFYFLEVNTRLQVEHPVTEEITGLDLVQMQIESAQGMPLQITQEQVSGTGYALEMRLYAENPANDFLPQTGTIHRFSYPEVEGLRMESAIASGSEISIYYDPMIAKIIVHDKNRQSAIQKMNYVLGNMVCIGVQTNQDFLKHLTEQATFVKGQYSTHYIQQHIDLDKFEKKDGITLTKAGIVATLYAWIQREQKRQLLSSLPSGWRNSFYEHQKDVYQQGEAIVEIKYRYLDSHFEMISGADTYRVKLISAKSDTVCIEMEGVQSTYHVFQNDMTLYIHGDDIGNIRLEKIERLPLPEKEIMKGGYSAPMPSQIIKILVEEGQKVEAGDALLIISSMKMENTISAEEDGRVVSIMTAEGENVEAGHPLIQISDN